MLAKLTLFGEQNTGKTSTLKYLIYLLLQHNESSIIGMVVSYISCKHITAKGL